MTSAKLIIIPNQTSVYRHWIHDNKDDSNNYYEIWPFEYMYVFLESDTIVGSYMTIKALYY